MAAFHRVERGEPAMIRVQRIRKQYGSTLAVNDVSLDVPDGMVTGLLGPNGAGKTTTIRAITGLTRPDAGGVEVDGVDVARHPMQARAQLGVVPETIGVYDHLTVREHVEYSAELQGVGAACINARIANLLTQMGLTALAARRAGGLSMGERRRLALARAMVHQPRNLVFDEPTNGLDVMSARDVRKEIRRQAAAGRAVLVSSHVMPEVAMLCDRVIVMAGGAIVVAGTPAELMQQTGCATLEDAFVRVIGSEEGLN
jgi:sodium transport system ATP-binding protein